MGVVAEAWPTQAQGCVFLVFMCFKFFSAVVSRVIWHKNTPIRHWLARCRLVAECKHAQVQPVQPAPLQR